MHMFINMTKTKSGQIHRFEILSGLCLHQYMWKGIFSLTDQFKILILHLLFTLNLLPAR